MQKSKFTYSFLLLFLSALIGGVVRFPGYGQNTNSTIQAAESGIAFHGYFTDNAVLQRQQPIAIWGSSTETNASLVVNFNNQNFTCKTDNSGRWKVTMPAMEAGGPYQLTASCNNKTAVLENILIGDVWLCGGQSNMAWLVRQADNFAKERKNADFPMIRHLKIRHVVSFQEETDFEKPTTAELQNAPKGHIWNVSSSETVGDFSAVAFFFAREIYQKTKIPIGIISNNWGGSEIETWIPKKGILSDEALSKAIKANYNSWAEVDLAAETKLKKQLFGKTDNTPNLADVEQYVTVNYDYSRWPAIGNPIGTVDWKGIWGFRGQGFLVKTVDLGKSYVTAKTQLSLAKDESPTLVYINGKLVHTDAGSKNNRIIKLEPNTWQEGKNVILLKVGTNPDKPLVSLGLEGTVNDLFISDATDKLSISEEWRCMPNFATKYEMAHLQNNFSCGTYNAMIHPMKDVKVKGILWYQGESNKSRAYQYQTSFPLLINEWRKIFGEVPFYWVSIASYGTTNYIPEGNQSSELREAQTMALSLPKTGEVITTDVGNPLDIHPTNKLTVGQRLSLHALKNEYNNPEIIAASPKMTSVSYKKGKAIVTFDHAGQGLSAKSKYGYVMGFEIKGKKDKYQLAKAEIKGNTVTVFYKGKPKAVRYAWADSPVDANVYSSEGLPATPFRTDTNISVTKDAKY
jgi:sialate O-acetylesterase